MVNVISLDTSNILYSNSCRMGSIMPLTGYPLKVIKYAIAEECPMSIYKAVTAQHCALQ